MAIVPNEAKGAYISPCADTLMVWQGFQFYPYVFSPAVFLPHLSQSARKSMEDQLNTGAPMILNPHCALIQIRKQTFGEHLPQNLSTIYHGYSPNLSLDHLLFAYDLLLPIGYSCWSDEDFIGRVCRVARRLNSRNMVAHRVVTRSLMKYARYFEQKIGNS